jgi:phage shock protein PspC (stress-responsive transcriptional regulator)
MAAAPARRHAGVDHPTGATVTETTTDTIPAPRRLYRARAGRHLGGVCAGLGRYFDLNPTIYRIAFVALALAGGTGILIYLAAWAVMPDEGVEDSYASELLRRHRDRPVRLIGLAVVAFAIVLTLSEARFWPSPGNLWLALALLVLGVVWWQLGERRPVGSGETPPPSPQRLPGLFPAAVGLALFALGIVGVLDATGATHVDWRIVLAVLVLLTGALVVGGAATGRRVGGVAVLGLLLLAPLALGLSVRVPLFAGVGDRTIQPAAVSELHSKYELGIGKLIVDLSDVGLPRGETFVKTTVGIGHLLVVVPKNATVEADGRAQGGDVVLLGREENGAHVHQTVVDRVGSGRVLVLDARIGFGKITVERG